MLRRLKCIGALGVMLLLALLVSAEQRFPPPDFESGYRLPSASTPAARHLWLQYADAGVFLAALAMAVWLIYKKRSRRGLFWLSLFSLAYFGFYRQGCICPIGSPQNVVYALFHPDYAAPVTVLIFCFAPIVVALFAGRAFCAGVCPQGALQDFMLIKPLTVPLWLEQALSVVPYIFLGAGLIYAGTGTGFVICRYDPFVPFFRLSGGLFILTAGAAFLLAGMFVGRPYCRFLCPYGGLLRLASMASKWRVRVTPDTCTQCRLCEQSCPFGAMREPAPAGTDPTGLRPERKRLGWLLALLPVLVVVGAWAGSQLSPAAAQLHPAVALAERYARQQSHPVQYGLMTPEALSLERAAENPAEVLKAAADLRRRFDLACWLFGGWVGLVIGVKLVALSARPSRTDYEPDRGACFGCARCFTACPNERVRLGLMPAAEGPAPS
ncbi:MAG: 4Fe-4S binding protein [Verrucomicrobiota bacterium]|jgi:ferredoxin